MRFAAIAIAAALFGNVFAMPSADAEAPDVVARSPLYGYVKAVGSHFSVLVYADGIIFRPRPIRISEPEEDTKVVPRTPLYGYVLYSSLVQLSKFLTVMVVLVLSAFLRQTTLRERTERICSATGPMWIFHIVTVAVLDIIFY
jgi:hypothetical protein